MKNAQNDYALYVLSTGRSMKKLLIALTALCMLANIDYAEAAPLLEVKVNGIKPGERLDDKYAACIHTTGEKHAKGNNINPEISWSGAPTNTKSFALIVVDPDVPFDLANANKEGAVIPRGMRRINYYHWLALNIPKDKTSIAEGQDSSYHGPCPPWNDEHIHHYHFKVFALDVPSIKIDGEVTAPKIINAIENHIVAKGEAIATFTTNLNLAK